MNMEYKQIGTAEYKRGVLIVDSPIFYRFIDAGLHQHVFKSVSNPLKVLKVYTAKVFTSVLEIRGFNKQFMLRNEFPLHERINFEGYLQGNDRVFPVYSQNRLTPVEVTIKTLHEELLPRVGTEMEKLGYIINNSHSFTNGELVIDNIDPWNIGYDRGELRFFSIDVYKME